MRELLSGRSGARRQRPSRWRAITHLFLAALLVCCMLTLAVPSISQAGILFSDFYSHDLEGDVYIEEDPVNVIWYGAGSAWDVQYDMKNLTSTIWTSTQGYGLYVYFTDSYNGGTDAWRFTNYQLMRTGDSFWGTRVHVRINGAGCPDPHYYGEWSVGCPHKESWCFLHLTHHVSSYSEGRTAVYYSFYGQPFVDSCYNIYIGNEGYYSNNTYHDGYATIIDLAY